MLLKIKKCGLSNISKLHNGCKEVYINWKEDTLHCCNYSFSILQKTKNWKYNVNNRIKCVKYIKTFIKNIEIPKYELPLDFEIIEPIIKIEPIIHK